MAIKAPEFKDSGWNSGLWPVTAIIGDGVFFITKLGDLWSKKGRNQGYTDRKVLDQAESDISNRVLNEVNALSLFSDCLLVELKLTKPTLDNSLREALIRWLDNPPDDKRLLITGPKLGKNEISSEWYKILNQTHAAIEANSISSHQFSKWLDDELKDQHISMNADARSALQTHTHGNLLAVGQVIERLRMIQPDLAKGSMISLDLILEVLTLSSNYTVYDLIDLALKGEIADTNRIADLLNWEGVQATTVLWAISRELDILLQMRFRMDHGEPVNHVINSLRIWRIRENLMRRVVDRLNLTQLRKILRLCHDTDRSIKSVSKEPAWSMIKDILLGLAGHPMSR